MRSTCLAIVLIALLAQGEWGGRLREG